MSAAEIAAGLTLCVALTLAGCGVEPSGPRICSKGHVFHATKGDGVYTLVRSYGDTIPCADTRNHLTKGQTDD
jgi:hypothetical protein